MPAPDGHCNKHDLAACLAEHGDGVRAADEGAQEDGEEQQVAENADGPRPYFASHSAERRCQAECVSENFAHEEGLVPHVNLCVEEPPQDVHCFFPL